MLMSAGATASAEQHTRAAVGTARYELLPLPGALAEARTLPVGSVITVTCSPRHGIGRTLDYAQTLASLGYHAVPHIAARLVDDRAALRRITERLAAHGINEVFIVGGDTAQPRGSYAGALSLLEDLARLPLRPARIGIPAYPEGHPTIDDARLRADLGAKSALANYAVTQLCFDAGTVLAWLERERQGGLTLPVYAGLPGAVDRGKLLGLGLRLGLGPSLRLIRRQTGLLGAALGNADFQANELLRGLTPALADPQAGLAGIHLFTFNRVAATRAWLNATSQDLGLALSGS